MRRPATREARRSPSSGTSSLPTPRRTTRPGPIAEMRSSSTSTLADRTRWTTALRERSLQHPRVVSADHRLDLFRGEMAGRPNEDVPLEWEARDVGDLPEAVPVLKDETLPIEL